MHSPAATDFCLLEFCCDAVSSSIVKKPSAAFHHGPVSHAHGHTHLQAVAPTDAAVPEPRLLSLTLHWGASLWTACTACVRGTCPPALRRVRHRLAPRHRASARAQQVSTVLWPLPCLCSGQPRDSPRGGAHSLRPPGCVLQECQAAPRRKTREAASFEPFWSRGRMLNEPHRTVCLPVCSSRIPRQPCLRNSAHQCGQQWRGSVGGIGVAVQAAAAWQCQF
jgi:hypothetical protein